MDIPAFSLTDGSGKPVNQQVFNDEWSLVFFGFTHCPDVCPTTLALMARLHRKMGDDAPSLVFVSVDPARDNWQHLASYVGAFDSSILALTGNVESINLLADALRTVFRKAGDDEFYMMDHTTNIALVNPGGQFVGYFRVPHDETNMQLALKEIL